MKKEDWISPAFQKYVSMVAVQDLLKRVRKPDILLLRPLCAPLGVLSGTEELCSIVEKSFTEKMDRPNYSHCC